MVARVAVISLSCWVMLCAHADRQESNGNAASVHQALKGFGDHTTGTQKAEECDRKLMGATCQEAPNAESQHHPTLNEAVEVSLADFRQRVRRHSAIHKFGDKGKWLPLLLEVFGAFVFFVCLYVTFRCLGCRRCLKPKRSMWSLQERFSQSLPTETDPLVNGWKKHGKHDIEQRKAPSVVTNGWRRDLPDSDVEAIRSNLRIGVSVANTAMKKHYCRGEKQH
eukprot:gnl/MRDRNA2_/MRDRNA2_97014_c0_seq1.p1 gnl/MRDRNA2_/MRDRNA2_97014_c0~~gnl/MRDRNA2_/MRDRNA2_97014_c0_seq1.p1  ORF type:complete len:223 (+),score=37.64 gnl/MRDRNA2_/MRDRNA2_97014_c0_seq1:96-764(+)